MENFEGIRLPWPDWKIVRHIGGGGYGQVYESEKYDNSYRRETVGIYCLLLINQVSVVTWQKFLKQVAWLQPFL